MHSGRYPLNSGGLRSPMSRTNINAIKQYCKSVKKELSCPRKIKSDLIARIMPDLEAYADENPNASFDDICDHFGTPKEVAESYLSSLDEDELKKRLKNAKKIWIAVIAVCTVVLLVFIAIYIYMILLNKHIEPVYYDEVISYGETIYLD